MECKTSSVKLIYLDCLLIQKISSFKSMGNSYKKGTAESSRKRFKVTSYMEDEQNIYDLMTEKLSELFR